LATPHRAASWVRAAAALSRRPWCGGRQKRRAQRLAEPLRTDRTGRAGCSLIR